MDSKLIDFPYKGSLRDILETSKVAGKFNFPIELSAISLIF